MEFAPTLADAVLAVLIVAAVSWIMNGRFRSLEAQIAANAAQIGHVRDEIQSTQQRLRDDMQTSHQSLRDELKSEITGLETRINARFEQVEARLLRVETELGALRSDVTQVALAVGARPQTRPGRA